MTVLDLIAKAIRRPTLHLVCIALLGGLGHGQAGQAPPRAGADGPAGDTIDELTRKAGLDTPESNYFVEKLAESNARQAVPMLEQKFARTKRELTPQNIADGSATLRDTDKAHTASALVRLGDTNHIYWDFLLQQATLAATGDAPAFLTYDSKGKDGPGPSPEFIAWAGAHGVAPGAVAEQELYLRPGVVGLLGVTGDRRAIPTLRRALLSPNYLVEIQAARGLAKIGDKQSIGLIVDACRKSPASASASIAAASLVYFNDQEAQTAAEAYIPRERLNALRENNHAPGGDPFR